jgi:hypothetical protein
MALLARTQSSHFAHLPGQNRPHNPQRRPAPPCAATSESGRGKGPPRFHPATSLVKATPPNRLAARPGRGRLTPPAARRRPNRSRGPRAQTSHAARRASKTEPVPRAPGSWGRTHLRPPPRKGPTRRRPRPGRRQAVPPYRRRAYSPTDASRTSRAARPRRTPRATAKGTPCHRRAPRAAVARGGPAGRAVAERQRGRVGRAVRARDRRDRGRRGPGRSGAGAVPRASRT